MNGRKISDTETTLLSGLASALVDPEMGFNVIIKSAVTNDDFAWKKMLTTLLTAAQDQTAGLPIKNFDSFLPLDTTQDKKDALSKVLYNFIKRFAALAVGFGKDTIFENNNLWDEYRETFVKTATNNNQLNTLMSFDAEGKIFKISSANHLAFWKQVEWSPTQTASKSNLDTPKLTNRSKSKMS